MSTVIAAADVGFSSKPFGMRIDGFLTVSHYSNYGSFSSKPSGIRFDSSYNLADAMIKAVSVVNLLG